MCMEENNLKISLALYIRLVFVFLVGEVSRLDTIYTVE